MPPLTLSCFRTFLPPFGLPAVLLGFTIAPESRFATFSVSRALESLQASFGWVRAASLTPRTGRQGTFSNNLEQTEAAVVRP